MSSNLARKKRHEGVGKQGRDGLLEILEHSAADEELAPALAASPLRLLMISVFADGVR